MLQPSILSTTNRTNAFVGIQPVNKVKSPIFNCSPDNKENSRGLKYVKAQGKDQSNPPLKINTGHQNSKQSPSSKLSFITNSHNKLEKTFTNIDENLHIMVQDHSLLKNTLQQQTINAHDQEQKLQRVQEKLDEYWGRENKLKSEKEELFKKIKVLLNENEKSTNFIELLAKADEEQKEEIQQLRDAYEQSLENNEQTKQQHANDIFDFEEQMKQNDYIMQQMDNEINSLSEQNSQLILSQEPNLLDQINDLMQKNEELSNQLMNQENELKCYLELEDRVEEVIQENEQQKTINFKLLEKYNAEINDSEKNKQLQRLQQKLKNTEIKLNVMSEENIRLNSILFNDQ